MVLSSPTWSQADSCSDLSDKRRSSVTGVNASLIRVLTPSLPLRQQSSTERWDPTRAGHASPASPRRCGNAAVECRVGKGHQAGYRARAPESGRQAAADSPDGCWIKLGCRWRHDGGGTRGCRPAPHPAAPDRRDYGGRSGNVATARTAWALPPRVGPGSWRVPGAVRSCLVSVVWRLSARYERC